MNRTKIIQCIGIASVLVIGSLATTGVFAHTPPGHKKHKHKQSDDDDNYSRYGDDDDNRSRYGDDDDNRSRYGDDDDNNARFDDDDHHNRDGDDDDNRSRYGDDDDNRSHYGDDDDGRWGHRYSDMSVQDVTFHDMGSHLQAVATVVGAKGEIPVELTLEATAEVRSTCAQPGTIARANERLDVETESAGSIQRAAIQGVRTIQVQTGDTSAVARELITCPSQRAANISQVRFLDARIDIAQGTDTLTLLCTFDVSTDDGQVAGENFDCTVL